MMAEADTILLGIDFGSGGCKVTAIGADGRLCGEASCTTHENELAARRPKTFRKPAKPN